MIKQGTEVHRFLEGGGEMGALTRAYDWTNSSLGPVSKWPTELKTAVGIVLHTDFPMFLWWGDDMIQFYNDGYRPSLGEEGKHPLALGQKGKDCWPEIWETIYPLIQQVRIENKSFFLKDQLIPIYRNGKLEDVYWTFSYSGVLAEDGTVAGVLVVCNETTSNIQALRVVGESERRFRTMAESTNILITVSDEKGDTVYFNNAWTRLTGRDEQKLLRQGWLDLIHPDDRENFLTVYGGALETKSSWSCEFRVMNKDGEYRWLLTEGPARFAEDGTFLGFISSSFDFTDRKTLEDRISESENRLRSVIESSPFPIAIYIGREMKVLVANKALIDVWGKGPDIIGKTYYDMLPELKEQDIYPLLDGVFTTGIAHNARNQRVDLVVNGVLGHYYFNYSFTPLFDADGKVYGVLNTASDVTDLNIAVKRLEQSEDNFRNMILQAPVAMCILLGPDHVVEIANDLMIAIWGKPKSDVQNKPIFEGLPDAREQGLEQLLKDVYQNGTTFRANERPVVLLRNGKYETVFQNFVYEPYRNSDGKILGVLAITIDVTPQVEARLKIEDVVRERTEALQKSNAELSQFAYITSHDLQEPARKISMFVDMVNKSLPSDIDKRARLYLDKIDGSASRMLRLIRDVLTFSQLRSKNFEFASVDLNRVLEEVKSDFELLIEEKQFEIISDRLPVVNAIPVQMNQLLTNLVSNALKFTRKEVSPVLRIGVEEFIHDEHHHFFNLVNGNKYFRLQFSDNGIGFSQENAEQIFDIFQRLHAKNEFPGTGIGLAMCRKIAENHGGLIYATSSTGIGTLFTVILPVLQS